MARDRRLAEGKNCGNAAAFEGDLRVTHGIHTAMKPMQMTGAQAGLDGVAVKAGVAQLVPADDTVLPTGNPGDHSIESGALFPHTGNKAPTPVPLPLPRAGAPFHCRFPDPSPFIAAFPSTVSGSSTPL